VEVDCGVGLWIGLILNTPEVEVLWFNQLRITESKGKGKVRSTTVHEGPEKE
jgi:hypothetical protein